MIPGKYSECIGTFAVMAMSLAAFAAEVDLSSDAVPETYKKEISAKASGVYEKDGLVYVHVKLPANTGKGRKDRKRMAALKEARMLLKAWTVNAFDGLKKTPDDLPGTWSVALCAIEAVNPGWRTRTWSAKSKMREFVEDGAKEYALGQVFPRRELLDEVTLKNIRPVTAESIAEELSQSVPYAFSDHDRQDVFVAKCHSNDAGETTDVEKRIAALKADKERLCALGDERLKAQDLIGSLMFYRECLKIDAGFAPALSGAAEVYRQLKLDRLAVGHAVLAIGLTKDSDVRERMKAILDK